MQRRTYSFPVAIPVTSVSVLWEGREVEVSLLDAVGGSLSIQRFTPNSLSHYSSSHSPEERLIARCQAAEAELQRIRAAVCPELENDLSE